MKEKLLNIFTKTIAFIIYKFLCFSSCMGINIIYPLIGMVGGMTILQLVFNNPELTAVYGFVYWLVAIIITISLMHSPV